MKALRFWMASMMLGTALLGLAGAADCTDDRMSHRERETQDSSRQQVDIHGRRTSCSRRWFGSLEPLLQHREVSLSLSPGDHRRYCGRERHATGALATQFAVSLSLSRHPTRSRS